MAKGSDADSIIHELRVAPGDAADLAQRNPASRLGLGEKADGRARTDESARGPRRPAQPALVGGPPQRDPRAAGHGRRGQGRHHPSGAHRSEPAGLLGRELQGADDRRPRARLPLAHPRRHAGAGDPRGLEPLALRGRGDRPLHRGDRRPPDPAALPPHPGLRADAPRRGHLDGQGLPPHLEGRAAGPAAGPHRRSGEELEVPPLRPRHPSAVGRVPGALRGGDLRHLDQLGAVARGARPTTSGCATWPWPRCWSMSLRGLDPQIPDPEPGLEGLVVE